MGTLGAPVGTSESAREFRSAADGSTKPESFLSLWVRRGDLLLCVAEVGPRTGLAACSTAGRDLDKSGFQLSTLLGSLPELSEELSDSRSGVEMTLGRDCDLFLKELTASSRPSPEVQSHAVLSRRSWGAGKEEQSLGVEMWSPLPMMVCSLWWGFL